MPKRRRKRSVLASEFARPVLGLVLLGLLWGAFKLGLVALFAEAILSPLVPEGPMNAGELYEQQMAKKADRQSD